MVFDYKVFYDIWQKPYNKRPDPNSNYKPNMAVGLKTGGTKIVGGTIAALLTGDIEVVIAGKAIGAAVGG